MQLTIKIDHYSGSPALRSISTMLSLEEKSAKENFILTESQVQALERKKHDDVVAGEIETAHPGYLGSQDTYYVGNLKGVGRIYQQTFIDTYAKVGFAKLYTTKTPTTSASLLHDNVLNFMNSISCLCFVF